MLKVKSHVMKPKEKLEKMNLNIVLEEGDSVLTSVQNAMVQKNIKEAVVVPVNVPEPSREMTETDVAVLFITDKLFALSASVMEREPSDNTTSPAVTVKTFEPPLPAIVTAPSSPTVNWLAAPS